jgi:glycosyltransferase involved in cell wall biosynthesis
VVIATRDRPEELRQCLRSVRSALSGDDEIIVVDSASRDAQHVARVAADAGAVLIRSERSGSARARNIGARRAHGEFIAFTDDDALVDPSWLEALAARFADPLVGAVVGPVFELGAQHSKLLFGHPDFDPARDTVSFDRATDEWFRRVRLGAIGSGANLAVRRGVFQNLGPFRESLGCGAPIGGDENYFLLSVVEEGQRVVSDPAVRVRHPAQSPSRLLELERSRLAYVLYVGLTRPNLRCQWLSLVASRLRPGRSGGSGAGIASSPLRAGVIRAARLLFAARRIDREMISVPPLTDFHTQPQHPLR